MRYRNQILIFLLAALMLPSVHVEAQGGLKLAKKIVKKVKKLFTDTRSLEDVYLLEGSRVVGTDPSFLVRQSEFPDYHFNLFSDFVVGEYDLNPETGLPRSETGFSHYQNEISAAGEKVNIVQAAKDMNPRINILLLLSYRSDYGQSKEYSSFYTNNFFDNKNRSQDSLIQRLQSTFTKWKEVYNIPEDRIGVVLDFQGLPKNKKLQQQFPNLVDRLKSEGLLVYVKLPIDFTTSGFFSDAKTLAAVEKSADLFLLNSYSYDIPNPAAYDCSSPTDMRTLEATLLTVREKNLIPIEKLVVEFPGFGRAVTRDEAGFSFQTNVAHGTIVDQHALQPTTPIQYIDSAQYAYAHFSDPYTEGHIYCFEDSTTLSAKLRWLIDGKLAAGVGFWGVGFMEEGQGIVNKDKWWWAIAEVAGKPKSKVGWIYASFFFLFASLGYIYSIFEYWQVRNILAKYSNIFWDHTMRFAIFFLVCLVCFNILPRNTVGLLFCGIVLGIFIVMRIIKRYTAKVRKYSRYAERF